MTTPRALVEGLVAALLGAALVWSLKPQASPRAAPTVTEEQSIQNAPRALATVSESAPSPAAKAPPREIVTSNDATRGILLFGNVTDREGKAIQIGLSIYNETDDETRFAPTHMIGKYSISNLSPGKWTIYAQGFGFKKLRKTIEIPSGATHVREDLVLERSIQIPVRIKMDDGERFVEYIQKASSSFSYLGRACTVVATLESPGARIPILGDEAYRYGIGTFATEGNNSRAMEKQPPDVDGMLELFENPPCFASLVMGANVITTKAVAPGDSPLDIIVKKEQIESAFGSIKLTVVETGAPGKGRILVSLNSTVGMRPFNTIGDTGAHSVERVIPGQYTVSIMGTKGAYINKAVVVEPGQSVDLGKIELGEYIKIPGRIVDSEGKPVLCHLEVVHLSGGQQAGASPRNGLMVDGNGKFTFFGYDGKYQLIASATGFATAVKNVDIPATAAEIVVTLQRGVPVIFVYSDNASTPARLTIEDSNGDSIWSRLSSDRPDDRLRLAAGLYKLQITDINGPRKTIPFEVSKNPVRLNVAW